MGWWPSAASPVTPQMDMAFKQSGSLVLVKHDGDELLDTASDDSFPTIQSPGRHIESREN